MNGFDAFDHHARSLNAFYLRAWRPPFCESSGEGENGLTERLLLRRRRWDSNASRLAMVVAKN